MKVRILKNGREIGPFDEQVVIAMLDAGELSDADLAMTEGLVDWTPLGQIVVREKTLPDRVAGLVQTGEQFATRVREQFRANPLAFGISALLFGGLVMFLSQCPVLLYGPFIFLALFAAIVRIRRSFSFPALLLLFISAFAPAWLWNSIYRQPAPGSLPVQSAPAKVAPDHLPPPSAIPAATSSPVTESIPSEVPAPPPGKPLAAVQSAIATPPPAGSTAPPRVSPPHPQAAAAAPAAIGSPAPHTFAPTVTPQQQQVLIQMFPQLGVKGSLLNQKYVAEFNRLKTENPSFFEDKTWPLILAQQCADSLVKSSASATLAPAAPVIPAPPPATAPPDAASGPLPDDPGTAAQLAAIYQKDQKAADSAFYGRRLTISGEISRIMSPDNPTIVALVYLKTGGGLPLVKVELNKMDRYRGKSSVSWDYITKNGFFMRVRDEAVLEVQSVNTVKDRWPYYYYYSRSHTTAGEWSPIISNGDNIKVVGTCNGRIMDVVLSNADLIQ
jgi:hypothetical protein